MIKNKITQSIFDLSISAIFILFSMAILKFSLPQGLTTDFLLRGFNLISYIAVALNIFFFNFLVF